MTLEHYVTSLEHGHGGGNWRRLIVQARLTNPQPK